MSWFRKLNPFTEKNSGQVLVAKTGLQLSSTDRIKQIIRHELLQQKLNAEAETFDEADDFEFDDGEEWASPYEVTFDPPSPEPDVPQGGTQTAPPANQGPTNAPEPPSPAPPG